MRAVGAVDEVCEFDDVGCDAAGGWRVAETVRFAPLASRRIRVTRRLLIVNPKAGQGRLQEMLRAALAERPWIEVHASESREDAIAAARRAVDEGVDVLALGGGDGTLHDLVSAVADRPPPALAVVPLGTANDLAKTLGVPLDDPAAALDLTRDGVVHPIDLIEMSDAEGTRWVVNAATAGFAERIEAALDDETKARWKALAYLRASIEVIPTLACGAYTIDVDGRVQVVEACALMVANGRYAGGFEFAPEADAADHTIDVLAVTAAELGERAGLGIDFALGQHLDSPHVWADRGREVHISGSPSLRFSVDGESCGQIPVRFTIRPGCVRFMVPQPAVAAPLAG